MLVATDQRAAAATGPTRQLWMIGWLIIIVIAIGLRLWMWSFQARSGAVPPGDPEEYYRAALHIMQGGYDDTGKWLRPPIYPAFLALSFRLFGADLSRALLAQAILSGLAVPAFGWLAQRLFRRRSISLITGLIAALFVPLASFGSVLFAEELFVLLMILALAALDRAIERQTFPTILLAGILFGLAALTRALAVSFIPLAALLIGVAGASSDTRRPARRLGLAATLMLGAALVIGPWVLRNAIVHQRLILSDTNGGISMWFGVVRSDAEQRSGEAQLWAIPNPADRQALALRWTVEKIIEDPLWFFGRMRFKIASLYLLQIRSFAVGDSITIDPRDQLVAMGAGENPLSWSAIADSQYILIMLAAITGICFAPDRRKLLPVLLWVLFATFMSAITIGHPRLRLPIVTVLMPCAAYGLVSAWNMVRGSYRSPKSPILNADIQGRQTRYRAFATRQTLPRQVVFMVAGWLIFVALIVSTRYVTWVRTWPDIRMANAALDRNEYNTARTYFERAQMTDPTNSLRVLNLADLAFQSGDYRAALPLYGQALKLEDRNLYAHAMRARSAALLGLGDIATAEQIALDGYGRDTNELYDWAWRNFDDPAPAQVVPGDPRALGQFVGFAAHSADLPTGRWSLGDARLRLADTCGQIALRVRGPVGRRVDLSIEGRNIHQAVTLTGTEQIVRVVIACSGNQDSAAQPTAQPALVRTQNSERAAITLRIQSPTALLDLDRAPWYVGVAVLEARIEPRS